MNSSYDFEAHKSYIHGIDEKICHYMYELQDWELCEFVTITPTCHDADYKIDYLSLLFCEMSKYVHMNRLKGALFLLLLILMRAVVLAALTYATAPNIVSIVKFLHLSQHNASTTAIVVINGLPDVLSAFIFFNGDTEMIANEMLGTGIYLWAFHGAILIIYYPHTLYGVYFMRDAIAFLIGLIIQCIINSERDTSVFEGICGLLFYPAYCFIVYVQHLGAVDERKKAEVDIAVRSKQRYNLIKEIEIVKYPLSSSANPLDVSLWEQFLIVLNPFRSELYDNAAKWQKVILILGVFIIIPVKLIIPVVDLKMPGDGWSRLLLSINIALAPIAFYLNFDFSFVYPCFAVSIPLAFIFLLKTTTDNPQYLFPIALYGALCVTAVVHEVETEMIAISVALGNIAGLKAPIVGYTMNVWVDTIPEVILYCTFVRWNYKTLPLMGFLMAPLFNMVLSLALTIILKSISRSTIDVVIRPGHIGVSGIWFSIIQHLLVSFAIITTNFNMRRSIGIFSLLTYFCFLFLIVLYQYDGIHAYGTDHVDEEKFFAAKWA